MRAFSHAALMRDFARTLFMCISTRTFARRFLVLLWVFAAEALEGIQCLLEVLLPGAAGKGDSLHFLVPFRSCYIIPETPSQAA